MPTSTVVGVNPKPYQQAIPCTWRNESMIRTNVESSQIASIGHDGELLEIEFTGKESSVYQYADLPADTMEKMLASESVGKFFYANIKGKCRYRKIVDGVAMGWIDPTKTGRADT